MAGAETGRILSKVATVLKVVVGISHSVGDVLVPQYPVKNSAIKIVSDIASGAGLISSLFFSSAVQSGLGALDAGGLTSNTRGFGAIVALVVSGWHFYELALCEEGDTRSAAILGEVRPGGDLVT
ncbi:uncharacterized protein N7496_008059 [Penicillium cataractarum]|uniref:Uncharacterized protein n=1 Tax=Penicillium cataractarum TaxID=2100454 RepID=A0A9W9S0A3_9EURO|nr:uncharacterized protein N7496_008059 [Penicillium cataractarum]KAJ5368299.1 hypothetical protein N7496_008059 [Penicillium cataractarum]